MRVVFHIFGSLGDIWPYANLCRGLKSAGVDACIAGPTFHQGRPELGGIEYICVGPDIPSDVQSYIDPKTADQRLAKFLVDNAEVAQSDIAGVLRGGDVVAYNFLTPGGASFAGSRGLQSVLCFHSPSRILRCAETFDYYASGYLVQPKFIFAMYPEDLCTISPEITYPLVRSCYPMGPQDAPISHQGVGHYLGSVVKDPGNFISSLVGACADLGLSLREEGDEHAPTVVHHGGIGTVIKYACLGRKQIVVPFMWDQPFNALLAEKFGAITVPYSVLSKETLKDAIVRVGTPEKILAWGTPQSCAEDFIAGLGVTPH